MWLNLPLSLLSSLPPFPPSFSPAMPPSFLHWCLRILGIRLDPWDSPCPPRAHSLGDLVMPLSGAGLPGCVEVGRAQVPH